MLVTFRTQAYANITMFGDLAVRILKLMGHSGTVPSAIQPEDIPAALQRLRVALDAEESCDDDELPSSDDDESAEMSVSLKTHAFPLIELLEAAAREDVPVSWEN